MQKKALKREEITYRKSSHQQILPLLVQVNKEIKQRPSDDDTSDASSYSYQCVYDPSDYEVGVSNM